MDIKAQSLYQDMQSMALQSKAGLGELNPASLNGIQVNPSGQNFADMLDTWLKQQVQSWR